LEFGDKVTNVARKSISICTSQYLLGGYWSKRKGKKPLASVMIVVNPYFPLKQPFEPFGNDVPLHTVQHSGE